LVNGEVPEQRANEPFLRRLLVNAPQHTGWTPWIDLSGAGDEQSRPYVFEGGWEALLDFLDPARAILWPSLDFWRIEPHGVFYHVRALEDDLAGDQGPRARTQLDFSLQIARSAEVISMGLAFGRSLGCNEATTSLVFGFRWTGLAGRILTALANARRMLRLTGIANQDQITTVVTIPLETPLAGITPHAENAVRDLFVLFGGVEFCSSVIEGIVRETFERRH
jgi:hypothetical protein